MMKHVALLLRILVAVAGISYIAYTVNWTDKVEVPAGTDLPNGQHLVEPALFPVVSGSYDPNNPSGELLVEIDEQGHTLPVPVAELNPQGDGPSFVPGVVTMLRHANFYLLALGLLMVGLIYPIQAVRWWMLMHCRGIGVKIWKAFRLTMVGSFFNYCMPGTTGGDLVKAYYAAKNSDRRADAVMSVIFDRIAGLLGLVVLAGVAGLLMLKDPLARMITYYIWCGVFIASMVALVYFSSTLRKRLGLQWLLERMPGRILHSIDDAATAYRHHSIVVVGAVLISVPVHLALCLSTSFAGYALGMTTDLGLMLIVIPVCFLVAAVPIAPQGIGVMEFFALTMLHQAPYAYPNQIVGMLLLIRIFQMFYSLWGSVFLLKGDIHLHPPQQDEPEAQSVSDLADTNDTSSSPGSTPSPEPVSSAS